MNEPSKDATLLLARISDGDARAAEELLPLVYDQLRGLAAGYFRGAAAQTLQPTALVHEAYLKLVDRSTGTWEDREHFCAVAATAMRQILVDHARRRRSLKRGEEREGMTLGGVSSPGGVDAVDLLALHDALQELRELDERQARLVELRFFGGLTVSEVASILKLSVSTVEKEWFRVRAWMSRALDGSK